MQDLTLAVEVIAVCMVLITLVVIVSGVVFVSTLKKLDRLMSDAKSQLNILSVKVLDTLHSAETLMGELRGQSGTIGKKSLDILHEAHDMLEYMHSQTKSLAVKASNGIAKVTVGSLAIGALTQLLRKKDKGD